MLNKKFIKEVVIYRTNESGETILDSEQKPIIDRTLGIFTFRRPTLRDQVSISVERSKQLRNVKSEELDPITKILVEFNSRFPLLVEDCPKDFDWDNLELVEVLAILDSFNTGIEELFSK